MSQRRFLEDNENIQGEGRPTRYAASQDNQKGHLAAEPPTTWLDWLGIFGMMLLTYLTIILIWVIGMYAIQRHFQAIVITFMVIFVIYAFVVGFAWSQGLKQRDELIKLFIQDKLRENQVEIGAQ